MNNYSRKENRSPVCSSGHDIDRFVQAGLEDAHYKHTVATYVMDNSTLGLAVPLPHPDQYTHAAAVAPAVLHVRLTQTPGAAPGRHSLPVPLPVLRLGLVIEKESPV